MRVFLAFAGLALFVVDQPAFAQSGSLDPTFGSGGIVTTWLSHQTREIAWVGIQPDGKILAAGDGAPDFFTAARYNEDGTLDTAFDQDGISAFSITDDGAVTVNDAVLQADGKLVIAGFVTDEFNGFALTRLNADGSVDSSFGVEGIVTTDITYYTDVGHAVALQSDGKIVVAGRYAGPDVDCLAVVRYMPTGALDSTFGNGDPGIFKLPQWQYGGHAGYDIAVQEDGKILVAGYGQLIWGRGFLLLRLLDEGILDDSYGTDGFVTVNFGGQSEAWALALQADGKAVVAGRAADLDGPGFAMVRCAIDGSLDPTFAGDGMTSLNIAGSSDAVARDLAILSGGRIVLTGPATYANDVFATACYLANGVLDISFGDNGVVVTDAGPQGSRAYTVVEDPEGRLIVGGNTHLYTDFSWYAMFALARYNMEPTATTEQGPVSDQLLVFPDPADGVIHIQGAAYGDLITVRSLSGQVLFRRRLEAEAIDVSMLSTGCYFLEIESDGRFAGRARFVVN